MTAVRLDLAYDGSGFSGWAAQPGLRTVQGEPAYEVVVPMQLADGSYRTCVPEGRPRRAFCVFVRTRQDPPVVRADPDRSPNAEYRTVQP